MVKSNKYDVVIIGGGPAGLTAGLYTSRDRLSSLLIERTAIGGSIINAEIVENYPGFPQGISGLELTNLMQEQATKYGAEILFAEVTGVKLDAQQKTISTTEGNFAARAVIIASGSERQKLDVPGEKEFTGRGVSYCAICDGAFFRDQTVAVVGGGNAAVNEALHLTKFAAKVFLIHRRHELRATRISQEKAFADPKITLLWDTVVEAIEGSEQVSTLKLRNVQSGEKSTLKVSGIFVATGSKPCTEFLKGALPLDENGSIITDENMETGITGVLAAGDIRAKSIRQVVSAAGDGAVAAVSAGRYISH